MEIHTQDLADGLRRRGHHVTVYAGPGSDPNLGAVSMWDGELKLSEAARADVSFSAEDILAEHMAYQRTILTLTRTPDFDLVHLNCTHQLPVSMAGLLPVPVTATLHCPPTPWLELAWRSSRQEGDAPQAVAVSRHLAEQWDAAMGWRPPVIGNGVDLNFWRLRDRCGDHAVWSGRLVPEKAPHLAIDAARLAGVPLVLAGPAYDQGYFTAEIEPRLGPEVTWVGHLGREQLAELVGTAAVALVTPVWEEPFGLVAIEALASGTPVAAVARGALPDLIDDEVGALALADAAALAEALLLARSRDRRAARARAVAMFDVTRMIDDYEAWMLDAVAGPRRFGGAT